MPDARKWHPRFVFMIGEMGSLLLLSASSGFFFLSYMTRAGDIERGWYLFCSIRRQEADLGKIMYFLEW